MMTLFYCCVAHTNALKQIDNSSINGMSPHEITNASFDLFMSAHFCSHCSDMDLDFYAMEQSESFALIAPIKIYIICRNCSETIDTHQRSENIVTGKLNITNSLKR